MLRIYVCITQQHDLRLVALAGLICLLASYTAFSLAGRAAQASSRSRAVWITASGLATGSGIWATHFIAMLAFQPDLPVAYELGRTVLSIVISALVSGAGLAIALRPRTRILGGLVVGAGIGAMHYTGMTALELPGEQVYDPTLAIVSLIIGMGLSAASTAVGFVQRGPARRVVAALLLTLGICGLHFTGMAAVAILPDAAVPLPGETIDPFWLATAITAVTVLILGLGLAGSSVDEHLTGRSIQEAARLRASEKRFRQLANATFEGIVLHVDGRMVDANQAMCTLLGKPLDWLIGREIWEIIAPGSHDLVRLRMLTGEHHTQEIELRHGDQETIAVEVVAQTIEYEGSTARVVAVRDIRERRAAEEQIRHMAHHDTLTGLPNRRMFHDRLNQAVALARRNGTTVAVLCLDLDRFKNVNDLSGHAGGDLLLRQVAERLSAGVRGQDTVARLSGDEFAIIQVGASHPDDASILAERLVKAIGTPFDLDGQQMVIGTSIGVSMFPSDADAGEDLVRAADTALYRAKGAGRGTYRFFESEMDARLQERRVLERDLRQALAVDQLELYYQPLVGCGTEDVMGFEALVRWHHPTRGLVSPAEFIPLAEECGLIMPLGSWVLRTACLEATRWPSDHRIAVNLSPIQFRHADLSKEILTILAQTGLAPERLELEITEGVLIEDTERTLATLKTLKAAGISVSLDDFGTGFSSLSYLQRFPFDKIKIDRSFIWEMEHNADSMAIVRSVIALGRSLRITVIAEGVETQEQLALLQNEQCDQVQGFLLGRPLPAQALARSPEAERDAAAAE
ncbi:MAG TPA: EAL domain-containing protein [Aliidongia sp.]|uniref:bifunctional diguanylate cyclase/phosphodiesterase n=1 Tax=Aliidongia sp. TaxID=1914230 RepID=UPI002DDC9679|nr:EAL domain-containing protein [Aliidongia sp.]HEV2676534.1 EAL domain-containing protein [Aliidongia sp.]